MAGHGHHRRPSPQALDLRFRPYDLQDRPDHSMPGTRRGTRSRHRPNRPDEFVPPPSKRRKHSSARRPAINSDVGVDSHAQTSHLTGAVSTQLPGPIIIPTHSPPNPLVDANKLPTHPTPSDSMKTDLDMFEVAGDLAPMEHESRSTSTTPRASRPKRDRSVSPSNPEIPRVDQPTTTPQAASSAPNAVMDACPIPAPPLPVIIAEDGPPIIQDSNTPLSNVKTINHSHPLPNFSANTHSIDPSPPDVSSSPVPTVSKSYNPYSHLQGKELPAHWFQNHNHHPSYAVHHPGYGPRAPGSVPLQPVAGPSQPVVRPPQPVAGPSQPVAGPSHSYRRSLTRTASDSSMNAPTPKASRAPTQLFSRTPSLAASIHDGEEHQSSARGADTDVDMDDLAGPPRNGRQELDQHVLMTILAGINGMRRDVQANRDELQNIRQILPQLIATEVQGHLQGTQPRHATAANPGNGEAGTTVAQPSRKKQVEKDAWRMPRNCEKGDWDLLKSAAREHLRKLLKIENTTRDELRKLPTGLTDEELKDLEYDAQGNCWSGTNFRIDFTKPWSCRPNAAAKRVFIQSFINAVGIGSYIVPEALLKAPFIEGRFYGYFNHLKPLVNSAHAGTQVSNILGTRRAQNARRKTLYQRCVDGCLSRSRLAPHVPLLKDQLRPINMSDDEAENDGPENKRWNIISVKWRSHDLTEMLRKLDSIYFENWRRPFSRRIHQEYRSTTMKTPGNIPRTRIPSALSAEGVAPVGLPRNCYDDEWYNALPDWARRDLDAQENTVYDFTIDERELRTL
ncbi:hypothetical protein BDN72DRAFT_900691 [Pluteus cervinus]|uniref:Uncharacterized protein n=1 Tax=Pluteus cervinus TaxID=181527 RepID=A0ACD3AJ43_9AGAR|nr:hypothetical protein BDN72DRAFT_900691 [Pluteus cervinus]